MTASNALLPSPRTALWAARVLWVGVALLTAWALADALDGHGGTGAAIATVAWWIVVAIVVVALVVPSALGLTGARLLVPASVPVAALAIAGGADIALGVGAFVVAALAAIVIMSGEAGEAFVQGSAYGDERRFPLSPPAAVLPFVVLAWALWCTALLSTLLLLAAEVWALAAIVGVSAVALTWLLASRAHSLSVRWLVLVPAGLVVHDGMVLAETVMVPRARLVRAELALAGTEAADLTGPAAGHAIEVEVREPVLVKFTVPRGQTTGRAIHASAFLVAPTRPGHALTALHAHSSLPRG